VLSGGSIRQFPVFWWGNRCWPAARGPGGWIGDADRNRLFHCHRRRLLGHRTSSAGREYFLDLLPPIAAPRVPNLQPAMLGTVKSPQHGLGPVQSSATFPAVPPEVSVSPPVAPPHSYPTTGGQCAVSRGRTGGRVADSAEAEGNQALGRNVPGLPRDRRDPELTRIRGSVDAQDGIERATTDRPGNPGSHRD
jgi:hypothetical protein